MNRTKMISTAGAVLLTLAVFGAPVFAQTGIQIGASGKTFASDAVNCVVNPATGNPAPSVDAGLYMPVKKSSATVSVNGTQMATVTAASPSTSLWLPEGVNTVTVSLNKRTADSYAFTVTPGMCISTSGNTFSADGTLEYAASGKSYATVTPGCALNGATGQTQPYINLFDNGTYLLNVSVNGVPLTQLSATRPHTPVFLSAGTNVITAVNGSLSTDTYVRDGGTGMCTL